MSGTGAVASCDPSLTSNLQQKLHGDGYHESTEDPDASSGRALLRRMRPYVHGPEGQAAAEHLLLLGLCSGDARAEAAAYSMPPVRQEVLAMAARKAPGEILQPPLRTQANRAATERATSLRAHLHLVSRAIRCEEIQRRDLLARLPAPSDGQAEATSPQRSHWPGDHIVAGDLRARPCAVRALSSARSLVVCEAAQRASRNARSHRSAQPRRLSLTGERSARAFQMQLGQAGSAVWQSAAVAVARPNSVCINKFQGPEPSGSVAGRRRRRGALPFDPRKCCHCCLLSAGRAL